MSSTFDKQAVAKRMIELSEYGVMPSTRKWDERRGDLPDRRTVVKHWGKRWIEIGEELNLSNNYSKVQIDHLKSEIIRMYEDGLGSDAISKRLSAKVSHTTIRSKLIEWGITLRDRHNANLGGPAGLRARKNRVSIISYYKSGHSTHQISEIYGLSSSYIARCLREWGVRTRPSRTDNYRSDLDEAKNEIIQSYASGATMTEIAKRFGANPATIGYRLREWGVRTITMQPETDMVNDDFFRRVP